MPWRSMRGSYHRSLGLEGASEVLYTHTQSILIFCDIVLKASVKTKLGNTELLLLEEI